MRCELQLADAGRWETQVVLLVKMIVRVLSTAEALPSSCYTGIGKGGALRRFGKQQ